jgi:hypothetical protein
MKRYACFVGVLAFAALDASANTNTVGRTVRILDTPSTSIQVDPIQQQVRFEPGEDFVYVRVRGEIQSDFQLNPGRLPVHWSSSSFDQPGSGLTCGSMPEISSPARRAKVPDRIRVAADPAEEEEASAEVVELPGGFNAAELHDRKIRWVPTTDSPDRLPELPFRATGFARYQPIGPGTAVTEDVVLRVNKLGYGFVYIDRISPMPPAPYVSHQSTTLYYAASEHRVLFSTRGFADLAQRFSASRLAANNPGTPPEQIARTVAIERQRGAYNVIDWPLFCETAALHDIEPLILPPANCPDSVVSFPKICEDDEVEITGTVSFREPDPAKPLHEQFPVTEAWVLLLDNQDQCVAATTTSAEPEDTGTYRFCCKTGDEASCLVDNTDTDSDSTSESGGAQGSPAEDPCDSDDSAAAVTAAMEEDPTYAVQVLSEGYLASVSECIELVGYALRNCEPRKEIARRPYAMRSHAFSPNSSQCINFPQSWIADDENSSDDIQADVDDNEPAVNEPAERHALEALEVYEAVTQAHLAFSRVGFQFEGPARVAYNTPSGATLTALWSTGEAQIELARAHGQYWDVIYHEFGHLVQHFGELANLQVGSHGLNEQLCGRYDKGKAIGLAWTEGWAGYFSAWIQQSMRDRYPPNGINDNDHVLKLGDTLFEDVGWDYDIETFQSFWGGYEFGEDSEVAVQRVLWDLADYATNDVYRPEPPEERDGWLDPEGSPDEISHGHDLLWRLVRDRRPNTLSDFFADYIDHIDGGHGDPSRMWMRLGRILAVHGIGPARAPDPDAEAWEWLFGTRSMRWYIRTHCAGVAYFQAPFDPEGKHIIPISEMSLLSLETPSRNFLTSLGPWQFINQSPYGSLGTRINLDDRWAAFGLWHDRKLTLMSSDLSYPATGPYPGETVTGRFSGYQLIRLVLGLTLVAWLWLWQPPLVQTSVASTQGNPNRIPWGVTLAALAVVAWVISRAFP